MSYGTMLQVIFVYIKVSSQLLLFVFKCHLFIPAGTHLLKAKSLIYRIVIR